MGKFPVLLSMMIQIMAEEKLQRHIEPSCHLISLHVLPVLCWKGLSSELLRRYSPTGPNLGFH